VRRIAHIRFGRAAAVTPAPTPARAPVQAE
jgi:hypothetical protein